jgi:hypothetical protein
VSEGLTNPEIMRVVNRYIGVADGYLGDFTYRSHREFYPEFCSLDIDPAGSPGTTRERFIQILSEATPRSQARIIRGVLERFPVGGGSAPQTRTKELRSDLEQMAARLEGTAVAATDPRFTSEVVRLAIADAETLLQTSGATSGVDRIHTALHGHLLAVCEAAGLQHPSGASITQLYKVLRERHSKLSQLGPRALEIDKILKALSVVVDALQPVRNLASVAHPNRDLLDPPEAMLVINAARTILYYLDTKLSD